MDRTRGQDDIPAAMAMLRARRRKHKTRGARRTVEETPEGAGGGWFFVFSSFRLSLHLQNDDFLVMS